MRKLCLRDSSPNAICDHAGFMQVSLRQQNRKLFAAIARSDVNLSERSSQTLRGDLQRAIPGLMAVAIVVELEIINVDHHEAHRIVVTPRSAQLLSQARFHITPIVQA